MAESLSAGSGTGGPNTHDPNVAEPELLPLGEFGIRDVGERDGSLKLFGKLAKPAASVDFVEERVGGHW